METLITILVLVLLSAISGWLKKRTETSESETWAPPPPPRTPGPGRPAPRPRTPTPGSPPERKPPARSWEEELRRLLEGERAPAPPPPPLPPTRGPSAPPTGPKSVPPVIASPKPARTTTLPSTPRPPRPSEIPAAEKFEHQETSTAREQAQRLKVRAETDLKRAGEAAARQLTQTRVTAHTDVTAEIATVRAWLRHPQSIRQAAIASVLLSPPVGMRPLDLTDLRPW